MTVYKVLLRSGFRVLSLVILMVMVVVVIRLTPFPDLDAPEESCNRPCHELEWPRICRFEFILESFAVSESSTCTNQSQYCFEDEFNYLSSNKLLTVNRQIPGPAIQVCLHDILVINVENRIPDRNVAIHWRGQAQAASPVMDGVPMITQCPIPSYTTFQYKFRASNVGTHTWHLYNDESGERIDFIIWTDEDEKEFNIKFVYLPSCDKKSVSIAKLKYVDKNSTSAISASLFSKFPKSKEFSTVAMENDQKLVSSLQNVQVLTNPQSIILRKNADITHYLYYGHRKAFLQNIKKKIDIAQINNITFKYPSSPLTSQINDVPPNQICNTNEVPEDCFREDSTICDCIHVINVEKGSVVDIILIHRDRKSEKGHIFHLHGHKFYLLNRLNSSNFEYTPDVESLDNSGKLNRNLEKPPLKDTVWIPPGGLAVIRFLAENAGYWMLREEESQGMEIVFNVFGSQYDVPVTFPHCGNFVGPKYFLA